MREFLARRVFNTPHVISQAKAEEIMQQVLIPKASTGKAPKAQVMEDDEAGTGGSADDGRPYDLTGDGIAIIPAFGTLLHRAGWLAAMSGVTSYQMLASAHAAAEADPEVRGILLEVDSPGGEGSGCFDHARAIVAQKRKPMHAVAADCALSGGFVFACCADRILVAETGLVGSVGVVMVHTDMSDFNRKNGFKYTYIHQGEYKAEFNPNEPLSPHARQTAERMVDVMHGVFVRYVADRRGLTEDAVRETQSAVFTGADAVNIGFADGIGGVDAALAGLRQALGASANMPTGAGFAPRTSAGAAAPVGATALNSEEKNMEVAEEGAGQSTGATDGGAATSTSASGQAPGATASGGNVVDMNAVRSETERAVSERAAAIVDLCGQAGVSGQASDFIKSGLSVEQVRAKLFDTMVSRDQTRNTDPSRGGTGGDSRATRGGWGNAIRQASALSGLKVEG